MSRVAPARDRVAQPCAPPAPCSPALARCTTSRRRPRSAGGLPVAAHRDGLGLRRGVPPRGCALKLAAEGAAFAVHAARIDRRQGVGGRQAGFFDQVEQGTGFWVQHGGVLVVAEWIGIGQA